MFLYGFDNIRKHLLFAEETIFSAISLVGAYGSKIKCLGTGSLSRIRSLVSLSYPIPIDVELQLMNRFTPDVCNAVNKVTKVPKTNSIERLKKKEYRKFDPYVL